MQESFVQYLNAWSACLSGQDCAPLEPLLEYWNTLPWHLISHLVGSFIFYYPLFMAYTWIIGAIFYYVFMERTIREKAGHLPRLSEYPAVSILIPCYNESANVRETVEYALQQNYPDFEVIAINDGSKDNTLEILQAMTGEHPGLRVVNLASNQGKAMALRAGALLARSEFLVCIDGDALLDPTAAAWMIRHFLENPDVGAVTGNPRIRTRSTLLGKIQVGEFSAIVGMIKRAQSVYGRIFTVSGVIAAFRRSALHQVGYWSNDMVTEDIDISWKLQLDGFLIRFEPRALCWVLMPETLNGLWRQRVRWAQGGAEVLIRYAHRMLHWSARRMWPIYIESLISILWAYCILAALCLDGVLSVLEFGHLRVSGVFPSWTGMLLSLTCLLQFAVSLRIDARYETDQKGAGRYYYWMIWYPLVYWLINVMTTVTGFYRALRKKRGQRAIWVTLDRGVTQRDRTRN